MLNKIQRRIISLLMAGTLVFSMAACGKSAEEKQMAQKREMNMEQSFEELPLDISGVEGELNEVFAKKGKLYLKSCENQEGKTQINRIYETDLEGKNVKELTPKLAENEYLEQFFVEAEGTFLGLTYAVNQETGKSEVNVIRFDNNGNVSAREDVTKVLKLGEKNVINGIAEDKNGNVIIACSNVVHILDKNFKSVKEIKAEEDWLVVDMALAKNGQIICAQKENNDESGREGDLKACVLNTETASWEEAFDIALAHVMSDDSLMDGAGDFDFYYKDESGILGYTIEENSSTKIVDYVSSFLLKEDADGMVSTGDGRFVDIIDKPDNTGTTVAVYTKTDPDAYAKREVITYGTAFSAYINPVIENAIAEFNKKNKDYRIEIVSYDNGEENPFTKMNAEIAAGRVPDILDLSYLPVRKYATLGLLEDLTPYYEKDAEISTEDFFPTVLESMKVDDKLYYVAPNFGIDTLVGKAKDVGTEQGWTYDDLKLLLEEKGDEVNLFYDEETSSRIEILSNLLLYGMTDFVNWETGECSFESQDFKDLLKICKDRGLKNETELTDAEINEIVDTSVAKMREGKVLLDVCYSISVDDIPRHKQIFGEEVTYVGYPNKERQGSSFVFTAMLGVSSKSQNKEKAWEFLRTFMTKEFQAKNQHPGYYHTPTRKDCFDMLVKAKTTKEPYTDEFGQEVEPIEEWTWMWGSVELKAEPLKQEDIDTFVDLINHTEKTEEFDEDMLNIIIEEAEPYFKGRKSLDKTAEIIQKRISTYVNEQR